MKKKTKERLKKIINIGIAFVLIGSIVISIVISLLAL